MSSSSSLLELIKKDPVADSGRLVIAGRLEGEPFAVGTNYQVRRLVAFVFSPMGQADVVRLTASLIGQTARFPHAWRTRHPGASACGESTAQASRPVTDGR